jgi:hypothetical protein
MRQFIVEADSSNDAARMILVWIEGQERIRSHAGEWIPCAQISRNLRAVSAALGSYGEAPLLPGSYLIDGRQIIGPE